MRSDENSIPATRTVSADPMFARQIPFQPLSRYMSPNVYVPAGQVYPPCDARPSVLSWPISYPPPVLFRGLGREVTFHVRLRDTSARAGTLDIGQGDAL